MNPNVIIHIMSLFWVAIGIQMLILKVCIYYAIYTSVIAAMIHLLHGCRPFTYWSIDEPICDTVISQLNGDAWPEYCMEFHLLHQNTAWWWNIMPSLNNFKWLLDNTKKHIHDKAHTHRVINNIIPVFVLMLGLLLILYQDCQGHSAISVRLANAH